MPRLGLSRLYWASIRAYWAGAVEMELTESRQPGEAWARHRGARAGVFGEAARGREFVQASIAPTSRPLQPWRRSPGRAAADRFANACGAAFAETAPKGRCPRRASSVELEPKACIYPSRLPMKTTSILFACILSLAAGAAAAQ